jgi:L-fuculose-phosphate aldolase
MSQELRRDLIDHAIAMNESGISQGTSGNISVRFQGGMLITPSGLDYAGMEPGDIVFVDSQGVSFGFRQPSSEWRFHLDIYRKRPDAHAILHAHPLHSAALACMNRSIPAFHYMVAVAGGKDIRCASYATFGTRALSDSVIEALAERKACLLANHGMVCLEKDLQRVLGLAIEVEQLARIYTQCLQIGEPSILSDEEMAVVLEKFKTYGANAPAGPGTG